MKDTLSAGYRAYAIQQLHVAIEKDADAPASAQMHEEQAAYALLVGRVPRKGEVLAYLVSNGEK